jgi:hypothetical protein
MVNKTGGLIRDLLFSDGFQNQTKVYSSNFLDPATRLVHTVKQVVTNQAISLLRICPSVTRIDNEPVTFSFDYFDTSTENLTAEVIYYDRTAMVS